MIQYDTAILRRPFPSRFHRRPQAGLDKHCRLDSKDSMVRKSQGLSLVNLPPNVPPPRNKGLIAGLIKGNQWLKSPYRGGVCWLAMTGKIKVIVEGQSDRSRTPQGRSQTPCTPILNGLQHANSKDGHMKQIKTLEFWRGISNRKFHQLQPSRWVLFGMSPLDFPTSFCTSIFSQHPLGDYILPTTLYKNLKNPLKDGWSLA